LAHNIFVLFQLNRGDKRQNIDKVISRLEWTIVLMRFHDDWLKLISSTISYL
jgi:hypothetical protein